MPGSPQGWSPGKEGCACSSGACEKSQLLTASTLGFRGMSPRSASWMQGGIVSPHFPMPPAPPPPGAGLVDGPEILIFWSHWYQGQRQPLKPPHPSGQSPLGGQGALSGDVWFPSPTINGTLWSCWCESSPTWCYSSANMSLRL